MILARSFSEHETSTISIFYALFERLGCMNILYTHVMNGRASGSSLTAYTMLDL